MNLQLEWVDSPRSDWIDDIESMAEGYPFEKRKKDLRDENAAARCRGTWTNGTAGGRFLAAFFEKKLVGWIRLRESSFLQEHLTAPFLVAEWELIQRNRDDIRGQLLDGIREQYPDSIVQFAQPSQNRTGRNFYLEQPDVRGGPTDIHLGRRLDGDALDRNDAGTEDTIYSLEASEVQLDELVPTSFNGYFSARALFSGETGGRLFRKKLETYRDRNNAGGYVSPAAEEPSLLLYEYEADPLPETTPTGRLTCVRFGKNAGPGLVHRAERDLRQAGMDYLDVRLEEGRDDEYHHLLDLGYEALTKRMYFFRIPESINPPIR